MNAVYVDMTFGCLHSQISVMNFKLVGTLQWLSMNSLYVDMTFGCLHSQIRVMDFKLVGTLQ